MSPMNALQAATAASTGTERLPGFGGARSRTELEEKAREFEAVFLGQMLQPMFSGLGAEKPFGGGMAEDMWRSMLADEYGRSLAGNGGIGIADAVVREVLKTQEIAPGLPPSERMHNPEEPAAEGVAAEDPIRNPTQGVQP